MLIQSIDRAFYLLEQLSAAGPDGLSLGTLAQTSGLNPPTARNLLATLVQLGYVVQPSGRGNYVLSDRLSFKTPGDRDTKLASFATPKIQQLSALVNETIVFSILRNDHRKTLVAMESQHSLKVSAQEGLDDNFYQTATGRVLLSQLRPAELKTFLRKHGLPGEKWPDVNSKQDLIRQLDEIKHNGYVSFIKGMVRTIAVPVIFANGKPRGALGLHYPSGRYPTAKIPGFIDNLNQTAQNIQQWS